MVFRCIHPLPKFNHSYNAKALCDACEDNEDTLMEWDDQVRRYERGEFVRSDFVIALHKSIDAEENALLEYAKRYKKFVLSENQTGRLS